jgi:hypothetical protein
MSWKFCPHCGGTLPSDLPAQGALPKPEVAVGRAGQYDPARFWKSLLKRVDSWQASHPGTVPGALALAKEAFVGAAPRLASATEPMRSIVHLAFDRRITPTGSLLTSILSDGRMIDDPIKLAAMGYAVRDGKVLLVDDMPVRSVYPLLQYWGGERQHRRWHLAGPIEVDPPSKRKSAHDGREPRGLRRNVAGRRTHGKCSRESRFRARRWRKRSARSR